MMVGIVGSELLRMRQLVKRAGVGRGTIQHYLREGLLPKPVKTHRNMAYYDPSCVERIQTIKDLQHKRHLPLNVIKKLLGGASGKSVNAKTLIDAQKTALDAMTPPAAGGSLGYRFATPFSLNKRSRCLPFSLRLSTTSPQRVCCANWRGNT